MTKKIWMLLVCLLLGSRVTGLALAQAEDSIREQATTQDQQQDLKVEYRDLLEKYQLAEREYIIAKQEMTQLGTLASIEKAFQNTKTAIVARNKVLIVYLRLLKLKLIDTHGVSLEFKAQVLAELDQIISQVENFGTVISQVKTKEELAQQVVIFIDLGLDVKKTSYQVMMLSTIGKLQVVHDKTSSFREEIENMVTDTPSKLRLAEKERSFQEVDALIANSKQKINYAATQVTAFHEADKDEDGDSVYSEVTGILEQAYVDLYQVHQYLEEIRL